MTKNVIVFILIVAFAATTISASQQSNPKVLIKTNYGDIQLELFINDAPITVENFLNYVQSGFYDGLIFHRIIKDFMIQGGGFDQDYNKKNTNSPITNESDNGLSNLRGTIAMARTFEADSATSQFFINHADNNDFLDKDTDLSGIGYCVFGQVIDGMDTVDAIAAVDTVNNVAFSTGDMNDVPVDPVIILSAQHLCYVATDGNDTTGIGTYDQPFATIQTAIDNTATGGTVILKPGTYTGQGNCDLTFSGKTMTVTSMDSNDIDPIAATIIDANGCFEEPHCGFMLDNLDNITIQKLTITGGHARFGAGIYSERANLLLENCIIETNWGTFDGGAVCLVSTDAIIRNCTIAAAYANYHRYGAIYCVNSNAAISNSIIYNEYSPEIYSYKSTVTVNHSNINGGYEGQGNIDIQLYFVDSENGNFHLKSQGWQWDITTNSWTFDDEKTCYCIDAGDPNLTFSNEPDVSILDPNNTRASRNPRVNMGAYANMPTASIAPFADFNSDTKVDFADYSKMMSVFSRNITGFAKQPEALIDMNKDSQIDYEDLAMLAEDWLLGN